MVFINDKPVLDICTTQFTLNNGTKFPAVGLGTWQGEVGAASEEALKSSIIHALRIGYRHIDTAQTYGVEHIVGEAIRESGVARQEIVITTKFFDSWFMDPAGALERSLAELGLDYVDLFLMHWPMPLDRDEKPLGPNGSWTFVDTWKAMEKLVGPKCRSIGVSNFTQKTLDVLLADATIVPAVNQVELHVLNPCLELVPYCKSKGIHVISWGTLGGQIPNGERMMINKILTNPLFTDIAEKHGASAGVVSLSWAVQRGISVIPKSSSAKRVEENIRLVELTDEEMRVLNTAHESIGRVRLAGQIETLKTIVDGKETYLGFTKVDMGWEDEEGNWLT